MQTISTGQTETTAIILKALPQITQAFERFPKRIFATVEFRQFINEQRESWQIGETTLNEFTQIMAKESLLKEAKLEFPNRPALRYTWGSVTTFELVQSLDEESYFSH